MTGKKERVDVLLVERGLVESRTRARAIVLAGKVFSGEQRLDKAGHRIARDAPLEVRGRDHPYVSRGGLKLERALADLDQDPAGWVVADFGASTGGFTDCLLQQGAVRVYAIDVGYGQLAHRLRQDPRVVVMERTNARHLDADSLPERVDAVVIDASFISIGKLLPAAHAVLRPGGRLLGMVKPQFEVGRYASDRGVVKDPAVRAKAIDDAIAEGEGLGFVLRGRCDSRLAGPRGNVEAFVWWERT